MALKRIAGVDEAGRGPAIGPMVVAGVLFARDKSDELKELGVKDSKNLSPETREELAYEIKNVAIDYRFFDLFPQTIDKVVLYNRKLKKLNYLTTMAMAKIIRDLNPEIAYVDACDVLSDRVGSQILRVLPYRPKIVCEHRADVNYPVVSAASILAKVRRDRFIEDLHQTYGDFNSGYSHDKKTRAWLREYFKMHQEVPDFIRASWYTVRKIRAEINQK